jgi:uncharacterized protein (TIGR01777 family)
MVLSRDGGALAKMLGPFRWGLGGRVGRGHQYWSWISLEDAVRALVFLLEQPVAGPINVTAPEPVTNRVFTRTLARVLRRPAWLPVPRWAVHLAWGEMADALLLSSARVLPQRLQSAGFAFRWPQLEAALRACI